MTASIACEPCETAQVKSDEPKAETVMLKTTIKYLKRTFQIYAEKSVYSKSLTLFSAHKWAPHHKGEAGSTGATVKLTNRGSSTGLTPSTIRITWSIVSTSDGWR